MRLLRCLSGQINLVKQRAKSLIVCRNAGQKFYAMSCQLQGLGLRITAMASASTMTEAMKVAFLYSRHSSSIPC
jgi:hypothetical protein